MSADLTGDARVTVAVMTAAVMVLAGCSAQVPTAVPPEPSSPEVASACAEPAQVVVEDDLPGARDVRYDEVASLTQVDNEVTRDDIIEITVSEPALVELSSQAGAVTSEVGWQVHVGTRQISGTPALRVFDLLLVDATGGSCRLHSVDPDSALLAPGEAQRRDAVLTFAVPGGPADDYELYLLDPQTREVVLRWP